jgi:hypothetical protein
MAFTARVANMASTATRTCRGVFGVYSAGNAHVEGDLSISGTISKSGGTFRIDHPGDPARKYLQHSFVESAEMLTVYSGTAQLDARGEATIDLPAWFEVLNRDVRYQLTPIGSPAPDLHVRSAIKDGHFTIAGGGAGLSVSWLLTATRNDPWAQTHPIAVEVPKPTADLGTYVHPELYGQPASKTIHGMRHVVAKVARLAPPKHPPKPMPIG